MACTPHLTADGKKGPDAGGRPCRLPCALTLPRQRTGPKMCTPYPFLRRGPTESSREMYSPASKHGVGGVDHIRVADTNPWGVRGLVWLRRPLCAWRGPWVRMMGVSRPHATFECLGVSESCCAARAHRRPLGHIPNVYPWVPKSGCLPRAAGLDHRTSDWTGGWSGLGWLARGWDRPKGHGLHRLQWEWTGGRDGAGDGLTACGREQPSLGDACSGVDPGTGHTSLTSMS